MTSRPDDEQALGPQPRPQRRGDLAVARRERPRDAAAAGGEVAARLARLRDARQRERHRLAGDEQHALVAVGDLGMKRCAITVRAPCWPTVSTITLRFGSSARTRNTDVPPMPSSGFTIVSRCASMNASIRAASRVTSVGAMNSREPRDRESSRCGRGSRAAD